MVFLNGSPVLEAVLQVMSPGAEALEGMLEGGGMADNRVNGEYI